MSYRVDQSPKVATKVPPMYSPRIDGGGVFASRVMPPSPLSKGLDGPVGSISSPGVDYDDVFGGPPRFATAVLAAQGGQKPSATLDRMPARTPSFRSPSLPVFELPVFGDHDAFGGSNSFEPRPASVAYDDIFREEVHPPDIYSGSGLYGSIPRSKATSRSSSRRMSPVHPAASLPDQLAQEEILAAANSAAFFKARSSAGKTGSRNSFSSPSFDGGRSNVSLMASSNDKVGSSLPSSPPHTSSRSYAKKFGAPNSANNLGASTNGDEDDDVFGGFPRRTYPPAFSAARTDALNSSRTHSVPTKGVAENKAPRSPFTSQSSESFEGLSRTLSSSSSSNGEQELQDDFIEIRMDRQSNLVTEKVEAAGGKTWVTVSDLKQSTQSTPKKASSKPPPAPASAVQLSHKSWKNWTSDMSTCQPLHSSSSVSVIDASVPSGVVLSRKKHLNNGYQHNRGSVEADSIKQLESKSAAQQSRGKYTLSSPLRTALKAKALEETMELEEKELQAMLNNAWKINEKRERKKNAAVVSPQGSLNAFNSKLQETCVKEGGRQPNKLPKALPHQPASQKIEDREADLHWKSWRKHTSKERKEATTVSMGIGSLHERKLTKAPGYSTQDIVRERDEDSAILNALSSEAEDSFDPEEMVKVVTEEMSINGSIKEVDRWSNVGRKMKSSGKGAEDVASFGIEKLSKDENEAAVPSSTNSSSQDFVHYSEQQEVIVSEMVEEIDSFIGSGASVEGFQDIEGESLERRKARLARHLHVKERAAKALEEMQQRDAEVQRQQEEKQQLAESADRKIKRWATGKEGNLRALLSNLQHVLWAEIGWQPISLTDLIEGPDVKKAYRKATLFVHPDKVQQKGATLQQKYIAERVFDILQEAWKTFNLQELF